MRGYIFATKCRDIFMAVSFGLCVVLPRISVGQDVEELRQGVTKILALVDGREKTGTGFVVRIDKDIAYIVTASHVIEGDKNPRVTFFAHQDTMVRGEVLRLEAGDDRGLALLVVRGEENLPRGLKALVIDASSVVRPADQTITIGFPRGAGVWAISNVMVSGTDGRDLVLSGQISEGNSGGPLIKQGKVVGLVTQEKQGYGRAVPSQILRSTLEGWGVSSSNDCRVEDVTTARTFPSKGPSADAERLVSEAEQLERANRHLEATKLLRTANELGHFRATIKLAVRYWTGTGVEKDEAEAIRLFRQVCEAAIAGDSYAQFLIGVAYALPAPWLSPDVTAPPKWYLRAADGGHVLAQYKLGDSYLSGKGVTADPRMVFKYWGMAAAQGYPQAQHSLGMLYVRGYGGVTDRKEGIGWLEKAAAQGLPASKSVLDILRVEEAAESGNPEFQYQLAQMYLTGKGVTQNVETAVKLYKSSAAKGYAPAQYNMGVRHENGDGVPRSLTKAFEWYLKAAEQGHANAQNNLGRMYMDGKAVPRNYVLGIVWFQLAAGQGLDDAKTNLNMSMRLHLSADDISRVNELTRTYRQRYSPKGK